MPFKTFDEFLRERGYAQEELYVSEEIGRDLVWGTYEPDPFNESGPVFRALLREDLDSLKEEWRKTLISNLPILDPNSIAPWGGIPGSFSPDKFVGEEFLINGKSWIVVSAGPDDPSWKWHPIVEEAARTIRWHPDIGWVQPRAVFYNVLNATYRGGNWLDSIAPMLPFVAIPFIMQAAAPAALQAGAELTAYDYTAEGIFAATEPEFVAPQSFASFTDTATGEIPLTETAPVEMAQTYPYIEPNVEEFPLTETAPIKTAQTYPYIEPIIEEFPLPEPSSVSTTQPVPAKAPSITPERAFQIFSIASRFFDSGDSSLPSPLTRSSKGTAIFTDPATGDQVVIDTETGEVILKIPGQKSILDWLPWIAAGAAFLVLIR